MNSDGRASISAIEKTAALYATMIIILIFCPMPSPFAARTSVEAVEEGVLLAPKFDAHGLIPVVTTDADNGEVLMHAYMNEAALLKTLETGEAHYYSRSRQQLRL